MADPFPTRSVMEDPPATTEVPAEGSVKKVSRAPLLPSSALPNQGHQLCHPPSLSPPPRPSPPPDWCPPPVCQVKKKRVSTNADGTPKKSSDTPGAEEKKVRVRSTTVRKVAPPSPADG